MRYNDVLRLQLPKQNNDSNYGDQESSIQVSLVQIFSQAIPLPRTYHAACLVDRFMFICGGEANSSDLQDFWVFDLELCAWTQLEVLSQTPFHAKRFHSCCSVSQNRVITFGGCHSEYVHLNDLNIFYLDDFVKSNGANKLVNCVKVNFDKNEICPSSRWGHTASVYGDKMYILGGISEIDIIDLFVFDPETL